MLRLPPSSTRTCTLFPERPLFRSVAAALAPQDWRHGAGYVECAEDVGGELPLDLAGLVLREEAELAVAGVFHQHVDAPEAGERGGDGGLGLGLLGDVERS